VQQPLREIRELAYPGVLDYTDLVGQFTAQRHHPD
jgi:hypothetical protein